MMLNRAVLPALALAILAGTALQASASGRIRIVGEGGIRDEWGLPAGTKLAVPGFPAKYAGHPAELCVTIGYLLNEDGHTSDFALLKSWSAQDPGKRGDEYWSAFAGEAAGAVAQWRFVPRPEVAKPRPVYTIAIFTFGSKDPAATRERCAVPDVPRRLVELRNDRRAGKMMVRGIYNNLDIDPLLEDRYQRNLRELRQQESQPKVWQPSSVPGSTPTPPVTPPPPSG